MFCDVAPVIRSERVNAKSALAPRGASSVRRQRDAQIAELWETGITHQQIADRLAITIGVVRSSVRRQHADGNLSRRRSSRRSADQLARDDAAILALRDEGMTHHGIATQLGLTFGNVSDAINRSRARRDLGDDLGLTPEVTEQLIALWREGLSQTAIARRQETTQSLTSERIKLLRARGCRWP